MKKKGLIISIIGICIIGGVGVGGYSVYGNKKVGEAVNVKPKVNTQEVKIESGKPNVQAVTVARIPAQKKVEEKEPSKEEVGIDKKVTNLNENTKEEVVYKYEEKKNSSNEKVKGDGYTYTNALATLKRAFGAKADEYNYRPIGNNGDNNGFGYLIAVDRKDNKSDENIGAWQVKPDGEVIEAG